ncbi:MAG: Ig-like domain-containing protein [Rhodoglobus sp.]|nr:Ig-like domain-containing protein [Rhodoglobus sp.]
MPDSLRALRRAANKVVVGVVVAVMGLLCIALPAQASESGLDYLDVDGNPARHDGEYTILDGSIHDLTAGWYYCNSTMSIFGGMTISGDVTLVLGPACDLSSRSVDYRAASIRVNSGDSLTIYTQDVGSPGKVTTILNPSGGSGAGIGGDGSVSAGSITIAGGLISARGSLGAGIGSGYAGTSGPIVITGGMIAATSDTGAGIGSGEAGTSGPIVITGGTITATGTSGAGIGSGYLGSSGDIAIVGSATVTAVRGFGASIGAGNFGTVAGSFVVATTGTVIAHTIGTFPPSTWLVRTTVTGDGTVLPVDFHIPTGLEDMFPSGQESATFSFSAGENATFTATPGIGSRLKTFTHDEDELIDGSTHTFTAIAAHHTLAAEFAEIIVIDTAEIAVDAPAFGEALDTSASASSDAYSSGSVTWTPSDATAGPATVYTASVTLTPETHHVVADGATATVNGTADGVTATRDGEALVVSATFSATEKAPTGLTLSASPEDGLTLPGDVRLTAALTGEHLSTLEGQTVTFTVNGTDVAETTDAAGVAHHLVESPTAGEHTFGAAFAGDPVNAASAADPISDFAVARGTRTVAVSGVVEDGEYTYGDATFTISATLTEDPALFSALLAPPSPEVDFTSSDPAIASVTDNGDGTAVVSIRKAGAVTLTASTEQTGDFEATSVDIPITIAAATPTVDLAATGVGDPFAPITLTATVSGSGSTPSGTVTFTDGITVLAENVPLVSGVASVTIEPPIRSGEHPYVAAFGGQAEFYTAATSDPVTVSIVAPTPTVDLTVTGGADTSQPVTLTASVSGLGPVPEGTVTFFDGATAVAEDVPLEGGAASLALTGVTAGEHVFRVVFTGTDGIYATANSDTITLIVDAAVDTPKPTPPTPTPGLSATGWSVPIGIIGASLALLVSGSLAVTFSVRRRVRS